MKRFSIFADYIIIIAYNNTNNTNTNNDNNNNNNDKRCLYIYDININRSKTHSIIQSIITLNLKATIKNNKVNKCDNNSLHVTKDDFYRVVTNYINCSSGRKYNKYKILFDYNSEYKLLYDIGKKFKLETSSIHKVFELRTTQIKSYVNNVKEYNKLMKYTYYNKVRELVDDIDERLYMEVNKEYPARIPNDFYFIVHVKNDNNNSVLGIFYIDDKLTLTKVVYNDKLVDYGSVTYDGDYLLNKASDVICGYISDDEGACSYMIDSATITMMYNHYGHLMINDILETYLNDVEGVLSIIEYEEFLKVW